MNKEEYLSAVWERIGHLPPADIRRSLDYYSEMIDDRMEEGHLTETQAVTAMPTVEEAAAQILAEAPVSPSAAPPEREPEADIPAPVQAGAKSGRVWHVWEIILLVLGSPLWLPLVISGAAIVLALYIVIWALVIVVLAVVLSVAVTAVAAAIRCVISLLQTALIAGLFYLGLALLCAGVVPFLYLAAKWAVKGVVWFTKLPFRRRGGNRA